MKAILLTSWKSKPEDNWYLWLKHQLENKGYDARVPVLPTMESNLPDPDKMKAILFLDVGVDKETTIIGHSLGSLLALRMAEKMMYKKMILVAPWDFNDLTLEHRLFWKKPIDHGIIKRNTKKRMCVTSDNDPYITAFQVEQMAKRLDAHYLCIKGKGHFGTDQNVTKLPEILDYL